MDGMTIAILDRNNEGTTWVSKDYFPMVGNSNMKCVALRYTKFFKLLLSISEMGRPSYVCTTCSEHFTRRYSATRHNHILHNGAAEIVRLIDYLAGRSSGQYTPNDPSWFKRNNQLHNFGSATVADSIGNAFEPRYMPRQIPLGTSEHYTSPIHRLPLTMQDQSYRTGLSLETKHKIDEFTRLMNKYSHFHTNPDRIIKLADIIPLMVTTHF